MFYSEQMPDSTMGTIHGLAVFKPHFTYVLATTLDLNTYVAVVPGIHPVIGLVSILVQRPSPPFMLASTCLYYYIT